MTYIEETVKTIQSWIKANYEVRVLKSEESKSGKVVVSYKLPHSQKFNGSVYIDKEDANEILIKAGLLKEKVIAKKVKLTVNQEETMKALKNATAFYKIGKEDITEDLYINGSSVALEKRMYRGNEILARKRLAILKADNQLAIEGNTNTIKALERKGMLEIVKVGGIAFDLVKLPNFEMPETFSELSKIQITNGDRTDIIYSPLGQEEKALNCFNELRNANYTILKVETVECTNSLDK